MKNTILLVLLLTISLGFAYTVTFQSGDAGESFARNTSMQKCSEAGVNTVFTCSGNVVRVNWTDSSRGLTFYKPDGRVVNCPPVPPTQAGADCFQMQTPNYCQERVVCSVVSQPPQPVNNTPQPTPNPRPTPTQNTTTPPVNNTPVPTPELTPNSTVSNPLVPSAPTPSPNANSTFALDNLMWIIIALGIIALAILFALFKRSIAE
ncbi:MAG: hypothetical protein ACP5N9_01520 [Candidatus Bilamarchaeum sp.]